jgi:hypothetical protein
MLAHTKDQHYFVTRCVAIIYLIILYNELLTLMSIIIKL